MHMVASLAYILKLRGKSHAIISTKGTVGVQKQSPTHSNRGYIRWGMVNAKLRQFYARDEPRYPMYVRLVGFKGRYGKVRRRENLLLSLGFEAQNLRPIVCQYTGYAIPAHNLDIRVYLTFRHRASSIQDRHFATLQRTFFIYLINKYISLSDICLTVHY